ncbi:MAG: histidine kinase [Chloroflexi bacterium]|nr:histidine kinase [Chloroflexota bacterium]
MQRLLRISINRNYGIFARIILLGFILFFGIQEYKLQTALLLALLFLLLLIVLAEATKYQAIYRKRSVNSWNLVLLFASSAALIQMDKQGVCLVYYFFLLGDVIYPAKTNIHPSILKRLLIFHFAAYFIRSLVAAYQSNTVNLIGQALFTILLSTAFYGGILIIVFSIRYYRNERTRLLALNNDLIDYSFQESKYLISSERSRISQQLHDSIGHSLIAVLMNIRYLKATRGDESASYQEELNEIEALVKESIEGLRTSVESMKELDDTIDLQGEIERLASRFNKLGVVHIDFQYDKAIDQAPNRIKNVLHDNIREGITNSIQHGDADTIEIRLQKVGDSIELIMKDNGKGVEHIVNSDGLNGILERVNSVHGRAEFKSDKGKGFNMCNSIPWEG